MTEWKRVCVVIFAAAHAYKVKEGGYSHGYVTMNNNEVLSAFCVSNINTTTSKTRADDVYTGRTREGTFLAGVFKIEEVSTHTKNG